MTTRFTRNDLSDPRLRHAVQRLLRKKLPAQEVDDVVQTVLTEALSAKEIPTNREAASQWLLGIARHKAVDFFRKRRELPTDAVALQATQPDHEERDFARFMLTEVEPEQAPLVEVLLREADGEKLEHLAQEKGISAPTLRQRVSRMRRFFKEKRALELALVAAALIAMAVALSKWRSGKPKLVPEIVAPRVDEPIARARDLRDRAKWSCARQLWQHCLDELDEAKKLDAAGEDSLEVRALRKQADEALHPPPAPKPSIFERKAAPPPTAAPWEGSTEGLPARPRRNPAPAGSGRASTPSG